MYSIDNTTEVYINKANPNPLPFITPSTSNMIPIRNGSIPNVTIDNDVFNIVFIIYCLLNLSAASQPNICLVAIYESSSIPSMPSEILFTKKDTLSLFT